MQIKQKKSTKINLNLNKIRFYENQKQIFAKCQILMHSYRKHTYLARLHIEITNRCTSGQPPISNVRTHETCAYIKKYDFAFS